MTQPDQSARAQGQSVKKRKSRAPSDLAIALMAWSIPHEFDHQIALALLDDLPEDRQTETWEAFLRELGQGAKLPIRVTQAGQFALSSPAREQSIAKWVASERSRKTYLRLNRLLADYFEKQWHQASTPQLGGSVSTYYLEESLFHHFVCDPAPAFDRFERLFQEYEWLKASSVCDRLLKIADTFENQLTVGQQLWLGYYRGKLYDVMARSPGTDGQTAMSHRREQRRVFEALLTAIDSKSNTAVVVADLRAMINVQLGNLALVDGGRLPEAADYFSRAVSDFQEAGSHDRELAAQNNLGLVLMQQRRLEEAVQHYEEMRRWLTASPAKDSYSLAVLSLNLGNAYAEVAASEEAKAARFEDVETLARKAADQFKQALDEFEESGFVYGQALAAATLGRWFLLRGEYEEAIAVLRAALQLLPKDSEERKEVEQWLEIAQQRRTTQTEPEKGIRLPELTDIQRLAMMYQFSRHVQQPHSLMAVEHEYQANWRELQAFTVAGASQSESADQLKQAVLLFNAGKFQGALARMEDTVRLARTEGNVRIELQALAWMPSIWECLGNFSKSIEASARLLAQAKQTGSADYQMRAGFRLASGLAAIDGRARWPEVSAVLLEGLQIARQLGNVFYEVYHLLTLGDCAWKAGQVEQGHGWLQDALNRLGPTVEQQHFFRASICQSLSGLMRQAGNHAEAIRYAQIAVGEATRTGSPYYLAGARLTLAQADLIRGDVAAALQTTEEVLPQARESQWRGIEQQGEYLRSEALVRLGLAASAYTAATRALELARASNMREAEVKCLVNVGEALSAQGKFDGARHTLSAARRLSQERNYADHFAQAEALLQTIAASGATP